MNAAIIEQPNGVLAISGELNFKSVPEIWQKSLKILERDDIHEIDFSAVTSASSAALALIIEYIKYNYFANKKALKLTGLSEQIKLISEAAGTDELLKNHSAFK